MNGDFITQRSTVAETRGFPQLPAGNNGRGCDELAQIGIRD